MDGVIYRGSRLIEGAKRFVSRLRKGGHKFVFLTNNAEKTPAELQKKLGDLGIHVGIEHFYTAAMATAAFLHQQKPGGKAYVIGGRGLLESLRGIRYTITDRDPDYVIVGSAENYDYQKISTAVHLVANGARLIGTSPDLTGPTEKGVVPACGSLIAPIQLSTQTTPYFIGKPSPLIMRMALRFLGTHSADTYMVGDRMDTDIVGGIESGMRTILVLSGVTNLGDVRRYGYQPEFIYQNVGEIPLPGDRPDPGRRRT